MSKKTKEQLAPISADYDEMLDLLTEYSRSANELTAIQTSLNEAALECAEDERGDYASHQVAMGDLEAAIEIIARKHPEWFTDKKSIKTPFGTVKFHSSTTIEIPNEEATVLLIESTKDKSIEKAIKQVKTVDKEVLESLDDAYLEKLRCKRVKKDNFSLSPAKVDLGKAVSTQEEKELKEVA